MVSQRLVKKNHKALKTIFKLKKHGIDSKEDFSLEHVEVLDLHLFVYQVSQPLHSVKKILDSSINL